MKILTLMSALFAVSSVAIDPAARYSPVLGKVTAKRGRRKRWRDDQSIKSAPGCGSSPKSHKNRNKKGKP